MSLKGVFMKSHEEDLERLRKFNTDALNEALRKAEYEANLRVENMRIIEQAVCRNFDSQHSALEEKLAELDKVIIAQKLFQKDLEIALLRRDNYNIESCKYPDVKINCVFSLISTGNKIPKRDYEERLMEQER